MERNTSEEGMDRLDIFQDRFEKLDEYIWWELEIIPTDSGMQFTSMEFQDECQTHGVRLTLEAPEHQEINREVIVTWRMLRTISHSLMLHGWVLEAYINFSLMYI